MEVVFTSFNFPTAVAMKMTRGPWFLSQFAGTWLFRPQVGGGTEVTFRYFFRVSLRWLQPFLHPIIAWVFQRDVRARLLGLKDGTEKGGLLNRLGQPGQHEALKH
jgi:hypothetical protein